MKERPILFSSEMVRAILDGRKTQTRRVFNPQPIADGLYYEYKDIPWLKTGDPFPFIGHLCPYGTHNDLLWVRETWRAVELDNGSDGILYKADNHFKSIENSQAAADLWCDAYADRKHGNKWRPSIFMPRWASRILLEVTDVRVERVQDINDEDAKAEGASISETRTMTHRGAFNILWDRINAHRGYSWESDPWVWAISFRVIEVKP